MTWGYQIDVACSLSLLDAALAATSITWISGWTARLDKYCEVPSFDEEEDWIKKTSSHKHIHKIMINTVVDTILFLSISCENMTQLKKYTWCKFSELQRPDDWVRIFARFAKRKCECYIIILSVDVNTVLYIHRCTCSLRAIVTFSMLWYPVTVVRGWHLGTATDVCSVWIWTSARPVSSVSSYTLLYYISSHAGGTVCQEFRETG